MSLWTWVGEKLGYAQELEECRAVLASVQSENILLKNKMRAIQIAAQDLSAKSEELEDRLHAYKPKI